MKCRTQFRGVATARGHAAGAAAVGSRPDEVVFTSGGTESVALAVWGLTRSRGAGGRVVTTAVEYPANMYPWMDAARRFNVELVTVPEETRPDDEKIHTAIVSACTWELSPGGRRR